MKTVKTKIVPRLHCLRCGHAWWRNPDNDHDPKCCPRCMNPNWKTEKKIPKYMTKGSGNGKKH